MEKKKKLYQVRVIAEVSLTFDEFRAASKKEALDIIINRRCRHPDHQDRIDYYDMIIRKFIKKHCVALEIKRDEDGKK